MTESEVLAEAASAVGLSSADAELIRRGENTLWRLSGDIVVRIARAGQREAATREVAVARWLAAQGVPAVEPLQMEQPVLTASGRPATFWMALPPHETGTEADLAELLRRLHGLPIPAIELGRLSPFVRIAERIAASRTATGEERSWLLQRLDQLKQRWSALPREGRSECVVHGDAWTGNCAVTTGPARRALLLDFERTALGPPEWDLTSTAVAYDTFGSLSEGRYRAYCDQYGYDVMDWPGYATLRGIRELRLATFALQIADQDPATREQARYRIACIRGQRGPRPWGWSPVG